MIMREMESAPVPGTNIRTDKIQKFNWNTQIGELGSNAMIDKWEINIDTSYQRNILDSRVLTIAKNWQWEAFGRLLVGNRSDRGLFIVDG